MKHKDRNRPSHNWRTCKYCGTRTEAVAYIATKIMGYRQAIGRLDIWYSRDGDPRTFDSFANISDAFLLVDKMRDSGWKPFELRHYTQWGAYFTRGFEVYSSHSDIAPTAISEAAIAAWMAKEEHGTE